MTLILFHIHAESTCYFRPARSARVSLYIGGDFPANMRCSLSVVLMLGHSQTYWPSIKSPMGRLVVGGTRTGSDLG